MSAKVERPTSRNQQWNGSAGSMRTYRRGANMYRVILRHVLHRNGLVAALLVTLGVAGLLYGFGSVVAGAQNGAAAAVPAPPEPCTNGPAGPCASCTSDVPGASDYENSLPVPSPAPGFNYVVQLVNESNRSEER